MAKRKKYPKLPNGYGSISFMGKGRRNPYAVRPPTKAFDQEGRAIREKPIAYVDDWMKGFAILTAYHAGTLTNETIAKYREPLNSDGRQLVEDIIKDYSAFAGNSPKSPNKTFRDVYEEFYKYKYEGIKQFSKSAEYSTRSAFKNCACLHDRVFADLRHDDLQKVLDDCKLKHASLELIASLFHQMYAYADIYDLTDKDYSTHLRINRPDDDEHGVPFSDADIAKLWTDSENPTACMLLIMIYSGFRVGEFREMVIDADTMTGGSKTKAGKHRTVPIHHRIQPLIPQRQRYDEHLISSPQTFRREMYAYLAQAGIRPHTPHDTRHTFSMLCERHGVSDHDRKRLMGHKIDDLTAGTYGHRSIDDLRVEIEKLP